MENLRGILYGGIIAIISSIVGVAIAEILRRNYLKTEFYFRKNLQKLDEEIKKLNEHAEKFRLFMAFMFTEDLKENIEKINLDSIKEILNIEIEKLPGISLKEEKLNMYIINFNSRSDFLREKIFEEIKAKNENKKVELMKDYLKYIFKMKQFLKENLI